MKIGFVIPARLKSERLKRKILLSLGNKTALEWTIIRAKRSLYIDEVVVATTSMNSDSEISKICNKNNVRYFMGDPDDVLDRLKETCEYFGFDYIINITPDNTLFSMHMVELLASKILENPDIDFLKYENAMLGTGVYALKKEALQTVCEFKKISDTEIWGPFFNENFFNVSIVQVPSFLSANYRLTMDTDLDYKMISRIYRDLKIDENNLLELDAIIEYLDNNPSVATINQEISQKSNSKQIIETINALYNNNEDEFYRIKRKFYE